MSLEKNLFQSLNSPTRRHILNEKPNLKDTNHQEFVISLLQKNSRNKLEIEFLRKALVNLKFFQEQNQNLPEELFNQLFKELQYFEVPKYEVVFNYGDYGNMYFIILRGSVEILLPKPHIQEECERDFKQGLNFSRESILKKIQQAKANFQNRNRQNQDIQLIRKPETPKLQRMISKHIKSLKEQNNKESFQLHLPLLKASEDNINEFIYEVYRDFIPVNTMLIGSSFGEIALITHQRRTATILCRENCCFMTLSKQSFDKILGYQHNRSLEVQLSFFRNIHYFENFQTNEILSIIQSMEITHPKVHEVIYQQNQDADFVYFILDGDFEISSFKKQDFSFKQQKVGLSVLTNGAIFGHEEILMGIPRQSTVVCKSAFSALYKLESKVKFLFLNILKAHNKLQPSVIDSKKSIDERFLKLQKNIKVTENVFNNLEKCLSLEKIKKSRSKDEFLKKPLSLKEKAKQINAQKGKSLASLWQLLLDTDKQKAELVLMRPPRYQKFLTQSKDLMDIAEKKSTQLSQNTEDLTSNCYMLDKSCIQNNPSKTDLFVKLENELNLIKHSKDNSQPPFPLTKWNQNDSSVSYQQKEVLWSIHVPSKEINIHTRKLRNKKKAQNRLQQLMNFKVNSL